MQAQCIEFSVLVVAIYVVHVVLYKVKILCFFLDKIIE